MRRHPSWAGGVFVLAAMVALPVWAQTDQQKPPVQPSQQPGIQKQPDHRLHPKPAPNPPSGPQAGSPPPKPGQPGRRPPPPPPPPAQPQVKGMPLSHVCLNASDAYSPGAVVTMNNKPYVCKPSPKDKSGVMHWMPMSDDS